MFRLDEICHIFAIWKILQYFFILSYFFSLYKGKKQHSSSKWIYEIYSKKRVKQFTKFIKYEHFISKDEIIIQQTTTWSNNSAWSQLTVRSLIYPLLIALFVNILYFHWFICRQLQSGFEIIYSLMLTSSCANSNC